MKSKETKQDMLFFIASYYEELEQKITFLKKLFKEGHENEASLPCCCYIEGFGSNYYSLDKGSCYNFFRILKEYGGNDIFWHIHPKQLKIEFAKNTDLKKILEKIKLPSPNSDQRLYSENGLLKMISSKLNTKEIKKNLDNRKGHYQKKNTS